MTDALEISKNDLIDFNSHAHVERDFTNTIVWLDHWISTHTLTWSVTSITIESFQNNDYFNSHAHVERDRVCSSAIRTSQNFNSHAHVERDWKT